MRRPTYADAVRWGMRFALGLAAAEFALIAVSIPLERTSYAGAIRAVLETMRIALNCWPIIVMPLILTVAGTRRRVRQTDTVPTAEEVVAGADNLAWATARLHIPSARANEWWAAENKARLDAQELAQQVIQLRGELARANVELRRLRSVANAVDMLDGSGD
jgi:hypothetical protein